MQRWFDYARILPLEITNLAGWSLAGLITRKSIDHWVLRVHPVLEILQCDQVARISKLIEYGLLVVDRCRICISDPSRVTHITTRI
jgi:hypothetical protein